MFGGDRRSQIITANAREGEVQERVDEESVAKYNEIIEILLAGGYFRARISGLSSFDKVVGGMAWSITSSNVDLDVDVFFQENANIKQKIKLSEKLIEALHKLKCPYPLQAQQIQGQDYINLFPIIQWLVAKVLETRAETGDLSRIYSESQFNKTYETPQDRDFNARKDLAVSFMEEVDDRYCPKRRFRRQKDVDSTPQSTLLEYGKLNRSATKDKQERKDDKAGIKSKLESTMAKADDDMEREERMISELSSHLDTVNDAAGVSGRNIGALVSADEISSAEQANYTPSGKGEGLSGEGQKMMAQKQHQHQVHALEKQVAVQTAALQKIKATHDALAQKVEEIQGEYNKRVALNERIILETQKLDALETPENTKQLQLLRQLVGLNESLRNQEAQFKASCKKQMVEWKALIESLQKGAGLGGDNDEEERERRQLVEETWNADTEKMKRVRGLLAKKNRDISQVERKIDDVPSRTELMQYQRQFVELYEQVASKLTETRQYYLSYNTLEDTRSVLAREVSILNSIHDNYKTAMASKASREKLIESMDSIVKGVLGNLEKEEGKLGREKKTADEISDRYMKLVEKERSYYKATREFQEECKKNELLLEKMAE
eukprot:TRINITY_DN2092_c0_g1_i2.p1 TRINITY_DN2092_c0_g1~~TRINITY_DN2092_c0_g1_i2.p1  ORF type:complete len:610 (-),score=212.75 TRINITY_DN2092_c0_g1_i2:101-1930(-)